MPVSPIGAAGLGMQVAGGVANAVGQSRRGRAARRAAADQARLAGDVAAENAGQQAFFDPQYQELPQAREQALTALIEAMGVPRAERLVQTQRGAGELQTGAADRIREMTPAALPFQNTGSGMTTALNARRRRMAMAAPGQQARQLQLAHGMLAPGDAQVLSAFGDVQTDTSRQFGDLQQAEGLRRALAASRFGLREQELLTQMHDARNTGMGLGALGQFVSNIGQGMTNHVAFPVEQQPYWLQPGFIGPLPNN